jgi:hypothetical protein
MREYALTAGDIDSYPDPIAGNRKNYKQPVKAISRSAGPGVPFVTTIVEDIVGVVHLGEAGALMANAFPSTT